MHGICQSRQASLHPTPQPRFDIERGDVIVRTGTGPVGMCLNTLTSVLGGYCTLWLSPKGNCAPTLPIRTLSAPFGGREHVRSAERSFGTRKAPTLGDAPKNSWTEFMKRLRPGSQL